MDSEAIYSRLGRFVLGFQSIETILTDTSHFILDPGRDPRIRWVLEQLPLRKLLDVTGTLITQALEDWKITGTEDFLAQFKRTWNECDSVVTRRNALVHSDYDYIGPCGSDELLAIFRSNVRVRRRVAGVDAEALTADQLDDDLRRLGECIAQLGMLKIQLIHWLPDHVKSGVRAGQPGSFPDSQAPEG